MSNQRPTHHGKEGHYGQLTSFDILNLEVSIQIPQLTSNHKLMSIHWLIDSY